MSSGQPTHSSQVLVSDVNRAFVKQWIQTYRQEKPPKALVLIGPSGVGMSTLVTLCFREERMDVVEVNGSTYSTRRHLKQLMQDALSLPIRRVILVEEPELMAPDGGLAEIVAFVRRRSRIPVVAVCNKHRKPKIGTLLQAAEVVNFTYRSRAELAKHFKGPIVTSDLRQLCIARDNSIGGLSTPDIRQDVLESVTLCMQGKVRVAERHDFSCDDPTSINLVHWNYVHVCGGDDMDIAAAAAHDLSDGDRLCAEGQGDLSADAGYLVSCVSLGRRTRKAPAKLLQDKVWTLQTFALGRWRGLQAAKPHFERHRMTLDPFSLPVVRDRLLQLGREDRWQDMADWVPECPIAQLIAVLRPGIKAKENSNLLSRIRRGVKRCTGE